MVKFTTLLTLIMAAIIISANPVAKKARKEIVRAYSNCLEVGSHCMTSRYRCCPHYGGGLMGPMPMTCFKFGDGVCEFYHRIPNAEEYKRLVKQLNATNFNQLSKQYWDSVYAG